MPIAATSVLIGLIFGPFAGIMAGLIIYEEYRHHYAEDNIPVREAIQAGIFGFLTLLGISVIAGFFVMYFSFK